MVNTEIPKSSTFSPSSYNGTPHLTINHDATIDLDSNNAFEGPEKLLEVWFSASELALPASCSSGGLKVVPAESWKEMLQLVNCRVLSVVESEHVDAYLLSESSMFVFPHKLILKTCGTTTLLRGLPRILELAATLAGFPHEVADCHGRATAAYPYRVFYSRKNFLHPDRQLGPHRNWEEEVKTLDRLFLGGSAYVIGKLNGDHWYLYLTEPHTQLTPPPSPHNGSPASRPFSSINSRESTEIDSDSVDDDETLEILMTDLDPENAQKFYLDHTVSVAEGQYFQRAREVKEEARRHVGSLSSLPTSNVSELQKSPMVNEIHEMDDVFSNSSGDPCDPISPDSSDYPEELCTEGHTLGTLVSESCGLADIYPTSKYPDARIDAYLFTPCGFSANGVVPAPSGPEKTHYFTVHVTPEPHCSYASFETNVPHKQTGRQTADLIEQVVNIFKPGRFTATLFEGKKSTTGEDDAKPLASKKDRRWETLNGYRRVDRIVHDLDGYDLVFKHFVKQDYFGKGVTIGTAGS